MAEPYNRFTGQSMERLTALNDGLFAVAMTLLVLDLRIPVSAAGPAYSEHGLWEALLKLGPSFAAYLLSFTMLGTFWLAQHTLLGILGRCDRTLTWISLGFLFVVSLLPFSAALLAHFTGLRLAVGAYWLNIGLLGVGLECAARYGRRMLIPDETITTWIDIGDVIELKWDALGKHVTQMSDKMPFFAFGIDGWREFWSREAFVLRESSVEAPKPESDLFAGIT